MNGTANRVAMQSGLTAIVTLMLVTSTGAQPLAMRIPRRSPDAAPDLPAAVFMTNASDSGIVYSAADSSTQASAGALDTTPPTMPDSARASGTTQSAPPRRHTSTAVTVLEAELANTAVASLGLIPGMSKPIAVLDGFCAFIFYMSPMDMNVQKGREAEVALPVLIAATGFAAMAVANWGTRDIQLTRQQKFVVNIAGPHVALGLAAGAEWLVKRLHHRPANARSSH